MEKTTKIIYLPPFVTIAEVQIEKGIATTGESGNYAGSFSEENADFN